MLLRVFAVMSSLGAWAPAADKTLIDYFLPTPIRGRLARDTWGADNVLPRDPRNGLEDTTIKQWCYWDGQIIAGPDGKFHRPAPLVGIRTRTPRNHSARRRHWAVAA